MSLTEKKEFLKACKTVANKCWVEGTPEQFKSPASLWIPLIKWSLHSFWYQWCSWPVVNLLSSLQQKFRSIPLLCRIVKLYVIDGTLQFNSRKLREGDILSITMPLPHPKERAIKAPDDRWFYLHMKHEGPGSWIWEKSNHYLPACLQWYWKKTSGNGFDFI